MCGLPEKQSSFLLQAGYDTLPTPMILAWWNIIVTAQCVPVCKDGSENLAVMRLVISSGWVYVAKVPHMHVPWPIHHELKPCP